MEDSQINDIARRFADLIAEDNASRSANAPTPMARIGGAIREALAAMTAERDAATVQTKHCDMIACNPRCLRCGDSPACGDGSWGWMDGVHRHRCRDSHPQCGHDRVPCEKHQPGELIALLRDEVKALRIVRDVKNAEVYRLTVERDAHAEAVRVLGECVRVTDSKDVHLKARCLEVCMKNPIARAAVEVER